MGLPVNLCISFLILLLLLSPFIFCNSCWWFSIIHYYRKILPTTLPPLTRCVFLYRTHLDTSNTVFSFWNYKLAFKYWQMLLQWIYCSCPRERGRMFYFTFRRVRILFFPAPLGKNSILVNLTTKPKKFVKTSNFVILLCENTQNLQFLVKLRQSDEFLHRAGKKNHSFPLGERDRKTILSRSVKISSNWLNTERERILFFPAR